MLFLGGDLKRREKISARLGDILSQLYLASCVLKRWHDDGRQQTDLPFVQWALQDASSASRRRSSGCSRTFRCGPRPGCCACWCFPWGKTFSAPDDRLGHRVSRLMMEDSPARDRLTAGMFIIAARRDPVGRLELALGQVRGRRADRGQGAGRGQVRRRSRHSPPAERIAAAVRGGAISAQEAETLERYEELRRACIMVDDFPPEIGRHAASEPDQASDFGGALGEEDRMSELVLLTVDEGVATLSFNRPQVFNAMDADMMIQFRAAAEQVQRGLRGARRGAARRGQGLSRRRRRGVVPSAHQGAAGHDRALGA